MSNGIKHISQGQQEFNIQFIGKNIEVTNALKEYVLEKLGKYEKLVPDIIDVHLRFEVSKNRVQQECMIDFKFSHFKVNVHAVTDDMYASIDKAFHKLSHKLHRWKERIQDHHGKSLASEEMEVQVLEHNSEMQKAEEEEIIDLNNDNVPIDFQTPKITRRKKRPLKTLTLDEALMKVDLSGDHFLVFNCEEDKMLKVLYRRRDGSYGIMIPQS